MKRHISTIVLVVLTVALLVMGIWHWKSEKRAKKTINELMEQIQKFKQDIAVLTDKTKELEQKKKKYEDAFLVKSSVYRNEKYGFEIRHMAERDPLTHDWEEKRHPNMPRRLWDATFFDRDFGVPIKHATGMPVIDITVNECLVGEDLDSCLINVTSCCGTVPFGKLEKIYGKGTLETGPTSFLNLPAKKLRISSCVGDRTDEGIAFLRGTRLYTILFLTAPELNRPFSWDVADWMLSTFAFSDEKKAEEKEVDQSLLPDLVIKNLYYRGPSPHLYVEYCNVGKSAPIEEAFLIKAETDAGIFPGNSGYPFFIPQPGECKTTGGFGIGLIGAKEGETKDVTVTIDWENTVREANEENNTTTKKIEFYPTENRCKDSDDGKDFYVAGSANIRQGMYGQGVSDCCRESEFGGSCVAEGPYLQEAICENNTPTRIIYKCPDGCRKGACIKK